MAVVAYAMCRVKLGALSEIDNTRKLWESAGPLSR